MIVVDVAADVGAVRRRAPRACAGSRRSPTVKFAISACCGHEPQRLLLALAADHDRRTAGRDRRRRVDGVLHAVVLALERRPLAAEHARQICSASSSRSKRSFTGGKSTPSASCSTSNHAAPMPRNARPLRDHVERRDDLGEDRRVAVGDAGDERAELDALACGPRARRAACRPRTSRARAGRAAAAGRSGPSPSRCRSRPPRPSTATAATRSKSSSAATSGIGEVGDLESDLDHPARMQVCRTLRSGRDEDRPEAGLLSSERGATPAGS